MFRFWAKAAKSEGCWNWKACKTWAGYGQFRFRGRNTHAHRVAWMIEIGEIPDGLHVIHLCDNPGCVNPSHLALATQKANMADMRLKGRASGGSLPGEKNPAAKLLMQEVQEIRLSVGNGMSHRKTARRFGISKSQVTRIVNGTSWR